MQQLKTVINAKTIHIFCLLTSPTSPWNSNEMFVFHTSILKQGNSGLRKENVLLAEVEDVALL